MCSDAMQSGEAEVLCPIERQSTHENGYGHKHAEASDSLPIMMTDGVVYVAPCVKRAKLDEVPFRAWHGRKNALLLKLSQVDPSKRENPRRGFSVLFWCIFGALFRRNKVTSATGSAH